MAVIKTMDRDEFDRAIERSIAYAVKRNGALSVVFYHGYHEFVGEWFCKTVKRKVVLWRCSPCPLQMAAVVEAIENDVEEERDAKA